MANYLSNIVDKLFKREVDRSNFKALLDRVDVENFFNRLHYYVDPYEMGLKIGNREILQKLYFDGEIYAAVDKRLTALLTTTLKLDGPNEAVTKFFEDQIKPFERQLKSDFWWSVPYGYSVVQILYRENGTVEGFQREPFWRFSPMPDQIHVMLNSGYNYKPNQLLDYGKWVLTVNNGSFGNPKGDAMFARLYLPWLFKCNAWDLWMQFAERYSIGFLLGKTPEVADVDNMLVMLEKARKGAALAVTTRDDVQLIQPSRDSSIYQVLDEKTTNLFYRVILGETQTALMQERGTSSSAEIHNEIRLEKTLNDINLVENAFEETMRQIGAVNGIDEKLIPKANLIYDKGLETGRATRDQILVGTGIKFTKDYYERQYGLAEDEFEIVETQPANDFSNLFEKKNNKSLFLTKKDVDSYMERNFGCPDCGGIHVD